VPVFTPKYSETEHGNKFIIGKAIKLTEEADLTIAATGNLVWEAYKILSNWKH
tara:strand:+ start:8579 stop:8737 length:159 start_codon:yes stop_codon:yes gene_type:complete